MEKLCEKSERLGSSRITRHPKTDHEDHSFVPVNALVLTDSMTLRCIPTRKPELCKNVVWFSLHSRPNLKSWTEPSPKSAPCT
jgi:hypothetical protein